ncbi:MAG: ADOP family duplicated permease [Longimicrobiales bacterium]
MGRSSSIWDRLRGGLARLAGLAQRSARQERLDEEVRLHMEMLTERNMRAGMPPEEARRAARVAFGGVDRFEEEASDEYRSRRLEELGRDVRRSVRNLVRAPAFTAAVVRSLALGIGATTVVFSVVDHVVLRPLPYRDPGRLIVIREVVHDIRDAYPTLGANAGHYMQWRERCAVCEDVAALRPIGLTRTDTGEPTRFDAVRVSANLFPLLGVQALHGRLFREDEDREGGGDVVVVSHGFWTRHLGADPAAVGRTLTLNGRTMTVVGVLPPDLRLPKRDELGPGVAMPDDPGLFIPLALTQQHIESGGQFDFVVLARMTPGVDAAAAQSHIDAIQAAISERSQRTVSASVRLLRDHVVVDARRGLGLLLAAVGAVLLLVCVNLANLLLARNAGRARESAVRVALGAPPGRLIRESLTESLVLALGAGIVGIILSHGGLAILLELAPADLPRLHEIRLDGRVTGVAISLSALTGLLVGVLPALRYSDGAPLDALRSGGRTQTEGRRATRSRGALIASQVALTTILLVISGLFLTSFVRVLGIDKGFQPDRLLALDVVVPFDEYPSFEALEQVHVRILDRLRSTPGITAATVTSKLPLEGTSWTDALAAEGNAGPREEQATGNYHFVTPEYFETLRIPFRHGEAFGEPHRGRDVVVLSERAADVLWPGENAVGRRITKNDFTYEVVGVAADVVATGLEAEASPIVYLPPWTSFGFYAWSASLVARTDIDPATLIGPARTAVREASAGTAIAKVRTLDQIVTQASAGRRFQLTLLIVFAVTALITACVGIYGVLAHSLARRRREIGVRMAFGARRAEIHRLVLREGLGAAGLGLAAGIAVTLAAARVFESLLFEVQPSNPLVLLSVSVLLVTVSGVASYVPARRASDGQVTAALRTE